MTEKGYDSFALAHSALIEHTKLKSVYAPAGARREPAVGIVRLETPVALKLAEFTSQRSLAFENFPHLFTGAEISQ